MSDGIIDLSNAPQHTGFGEDTGLEKETSGDFSDSALSASLVYPGINAGANISTAVDDATPRLERLFDGDAALDDILALMQDYTAIGAAMLEAVDIAWANWNGPDPGFAAAALTRQGLEFMLAYFQPLQDAVGIVLGNAERIKVTSEMWQTTASSLLKLGDYMGEVVIGQIAPNWQGAARDAAVQRLGEMQDAIGVAALLSAMTATLMDLTSQFVTCVNNRAKAHLADTVGQVIGLLCAVLTLNIPELMSAIVTAALYILKITLEVITLALAAVRVYAAAVTLLAALQDNLEKTVELLDRMAEGC